MYDEINTITWEDPLPPRSFYLNCNQIIPNFYFMGNEQDREPS